MHPQHDPAPDRPRLLQRLQRHLEHHSWPRLQMALLVALTGGAGLVASFGLLQAGLQAMWLRYPLAVAAAYLVFLALLWLWLRTQASDHADLPIDLGGVGGPGGPSGGPGLPSPVSGGGGDFAGGGASASFDAPAAPPEPESLSEGVGQSLGVAAEAEEFAIPMVVIVLALGLALSSFYVVYAAPTLFAELLLDGALATTLYRRLRGLEPRHWVGTALRRTALPFALTALFLALCGAALQAHAPQAHTLGQALRPADRP